MKPKEITQLIVAIVIFAIAGFLIYSQLGPKSGGKDGKGVSVEKVTKIPSGFNDQSLSVIGDSSRVRDFYSPPDLGSGLGNSQPFGTK